MGRIPGKRAGGRDGQKVVPQERGVLGRGKHRHERDRKIKVAVTAAGVQGGVKQRKCFYSSDRKRWGGG